MTSPNDPAFPVDLDHSNASAEMMAHQIKLLGGLTKREYFAAIALNGYLSDGSGAKWNETQFAMAAVLSADALITELNKEKK